MAYCSNCGQQISDQAMACPQCGHPGPAARPVAPTGAPITTQDISFASWGQRVGAALLDGLIVSIPAYILMAIIGIGIVSRGGVRIDPTPGELSAASRNLLVGIFVSVALFGVIGILYKVLMEGSPRGQTLGKMALHIQVRDAVTGGPITYGKAFVRWLVQVVLWAVFYVGGIVDALFPLWDVKRQTLHDKAAGTIVVQAPQ